MFLRHSLNQFRQRNPEKIFITFHRQTVTISIDIISRPCKTLSTCNLITRSQIHLRSVIPTVRIIPNISTSMAGRCCNNMITTNFNWHSCQNNRISTVIIIQNSVLIIATKISYHIIGKIAKISTIKLISKSGYGHNTDHKNSRKNSQKLFHKNHLSKK